MLRAALICPEEGLAQELAGLLRRIPGVDIAAYSQQYPSPEDLLRGIRVQNVDVLLLSAGNLETAEALAAAVDQHLPGFPVITVSESSDPRILAKLMHVGVREHLASPIQGTALADAIEAARRRAMVALQRAVTPQGDLYSFFPARAGVGATTVATAVSCSLANELNVRTLLMDCDLHGGAIRFLLKLDRSASVLDVLRDAERLDDSFWQQMLGRCGKLQVLHAGTLEPPATADLAGLATALYTARSQFQAVCVDLAGSLDPLSSTLLQESSKIFLVTTGEVVALHMAALRIRQLSDRGLRDRIQLVLNRRVQKSKLPLGDIETALGMPIAFQLANDYTGVQTAIIDGAPSQVRGELGNNLRDLARTLAPGHEQRSEAPRRKFLEFFSVPSSGGSGWMR